MKYLFLLIASLLLLGSCTTQKKCSKRFPPKVSYIEKTIIRDSLIYIHDTVHIKGDTVFSTETVYQDKETGLIWSNKSETETDFAWSWAQVQNSVLKHELIQKDSAIARLLSENIQIKEVIKETTIEVPVPYIKWYHTAAVWIAVPVLLLILAFIAYHVIKLIRKIWLPI